MRVRKKISAFTLVELLVVISIIAVLLAVLVPVLGQARDAAQSVKCLSNLRNMSMTVNVYLDLYKERFPPAYRFEPDQMIGWDFTLNYSDGKYTPGAIWAGGKTSLEIQQCPTMDGDSNAGTDPYTGYNYNTSYLGSPAHSTDLSEVRSPALCAAFGDGTFGAYGANKYMRAPWGGGYDQTEIGGDVSTRGAGAQGFIHLGATNVAFVDGHAKSMKPPYRNTSAQALTTLADNGGFLSPDNSLYDLE